MVCGWLAGLCGLDCNLHSVCFLLPGSEQASGAKHAESIAIQIVGKSTLNAPVQMSQHQAAVMV